MLDARATLTERAAARGESLSALSRMIGRNVAYLGQFVTRGTPRVLDPGDRRLLADHLGIDEALLGGTVPKRPLRLPILDVAASAGSGSLIEDEAMVGVGTMDAELARQLGLQAGSASVIAVRGDSMAPGIMAGDQIVVDEASRRPDATGGVYVIRIDGMVMVKRVRRHGRGLIATSDNPAAPPVPRGTVEIIGRVVWQMRRPR